MLEIFSTGTPIPAFRAYAGTKIRFEGQVFEVVSHLPMKWKEMVRVQLRRYDGAIITARFGWDEILTIAQEEDFENPATAMEIWLALGDSR